MIILRKVVLKTHSIENEFQNIYPWCSVQLQASSDFNFSKVVKIWRISLQYLNVSLWDFSAINFHSLTWFSSCLLSICSCWMGFFNWSTSRSINCLLFNSMAASFLFLFIIEDNWKVRFAERIGWYTMRRWKTRNDNFVEMNRIIGRKRAEYNLVGSRWSHNQLLFPTGGKGGRLV